SIVLAVAVAFGAEWYLRRTRHGLAMRALGSSPRVTEALGIPTTATTTMAMALAGGLAGLAAVHYVLGAKGLAEEGLGDGVGCVVARARMVSWARATFCLRIRRMSVMSTLASCARQQS